MRGEPGRISAMGRSRDFRHSHGGTGCGSAHKLSRASFSNHSNTAPPQQLTLEEWNRNRLGARTAHARQKLSIYSLSKAFRLSCFLQYFGRLVLHGGLMLMWLPRSDQ